MRIVNIDEITPLIDKDVIIDAIKQSYISKESGEIFSPQPMQILFHNDQSDLTGDCHVKAAIHRQKPFYAIKIASGFYGNKNIGLPVNSGLTVLLSSSTGQPEVLLNDGGMLTSLRTAAAGAVAASLAHNITSKTVLGIIGTGNQAELQAHWISHKTGIKNMVVLGRNYDQSVQFSNKLSSFGYQVRAAENAQNLASEAKVIVTTTPSAEPVLMSSDVPNGVHIVALGADSPGKQELDPQLIKRAEIILTDDHQQCLDHGEFGIAVRNDLIDPNADVALGALLSGSHKTAISGAGISIVDLTGLGGQDLAIATVIWDRITK